MWRKPDDMRLLQTEASESGVGTCALKEDGDMVRSRRESNDPFISRMQWRKTYLRFQMAR